MIERIEMSAPDIDEHDVAIVADVVRSGRLALGPRVDEFEDAIREYVGVRHAVAVSSGTAALHIAVRGLGIGPGDEVLVPSFTFAATVNVILFEGATPVFVDITEDTFTLDVEDARRKITTRTRAILAVDVFGHPAEWPELEALAAEYGLSTIDDSCEALGSAIAGVRIGRFADAATFGFYPNKQITTGEGGVLVTDSDELAALARSLRNQGRGSMGAWLAHERLGYNYRLDEMSAALGISQLARVDEILARREFVANQYLERLDGLTRVRSPRIRPGVTISWFVFVILLDRQVDRDNVVRELDTVGIPSRVYFSPIHSQSYLRSCRTLGGDSLPVTEEIGTRVLALPFHGAMTTEQIDRVCGVLVQAVDRRVPT